jgi:hypothetical protein
MNETIDLAPDEFKSNMLLIFITGGVLLLITTISVFFLLYQRYRKRANYESIPNNNRKPRVNTTTGKIFISLSKTHSLTTELNHFVS